MRECQSDAPGCGGRDIYLKRTDGHVFCNCEYHLKRRSSNFIKLLQETTREEWEAFQIIGQ